MKTLDQIRAQFAWQRVQGANKEYRNLAKGLPALVMNNGLLQTLAFLQGKANDQSRNEHSRLLKDILTWLSDDQVKVLSAAEAKDFASAMPTLVGRDSLHYQRATEETLAILRWIRYLVDTVV